MGYEVERFVTRVDEEYICSICLGVFESPVHGPCGHTFCLKCIENWIPVNVNSCPLDKKPLFKKDLVPVSIPFRNLLNKLDIKCDYESAGCTNVCVMAGLPSHVKICPFNPDGEMVCDQGCDLTFLRRERDSHKCIIALKDLVVKQKCEIADLNKRMSAKRSYDTAFYRFPPDRAAVNDYMSMHEDRLEVLNRHRRLLHRSAVRSANYEPTTGPRARTPPPPNISISSRIHHPVGQSGTSAAQLSRSRLSVPMELAEVQVQVQRLTDEDLDLYGVTRPHSSSRILSSQLSMQPLSTADRSSLTDISSAPQSQQLPSSSTSSSGSSSSSSSSQSSQEEVTVGGRFNLLTRMLTGTPGCSSTRND